MDCEENRSDSNDEESTEKTAMSDSKSDPERFADHPETFMDCNGNKCVNKDSSVSSQDGQPRGQQKGIDEGHEMDGTVPVHCHVNQVKCSMESNNFFSTLDLLPRKREREFLNDSCLLNNAPRKKQHQDSELAAHGEYHYNLVKPHTLHSKYLFLLIDQFHSDPYDCFKRPVNRSEWLLTCYVLFTVEFYIVYDHSHT